LVWVGHEHVTTFDELGLGSQAANNYAAIYRQPNEGLLSVAERFDRHGDSKKLAGDAQTVNQKIS